MRDRGLLAMLVFWLNACFGGSEALVQTAELLDAPRRAQIAAEVNEHVDAVIRVERELVATARVAQADIDRAVASADLALALINQEPWLVEGQTMTPAAIRERADALRRTRVYEVRVDARGDAQTGVAVSTDDIVFLYVTEGAWTAKGGGSGWDTQPGTGYPNYEPGLFTDYRRCTSVRMGALIALAGGRCWGAENWVSMSSAGVLELAMNDNYASDNAGLLTVRVIVQKAKPK